MVGCIAMSMNLFWKIKAVSKVRDEVEERLVKESDNVRLWQMRIKTAIEQVVLTIVTTPLRNLEHVPLSKPAIEVNMITVCSG